jgi:hypothetical protein
MVRSGQLNNALRALAEELHGHGLLPLEEGLLDGTFASAEKGGLAVGPTKRGKGTTIIAIASVTSLPLAVTVDSASPHETKLVEETLTGGVLDELPARLIGDRADDSDPLDRRWKHDYGIRVDRAQPGGPQSDRGWARAATLQATLECRAVICLVAMVPATGHAPRISHRELSRHGPPRLEENDAEVFVSDYSYRSATMGSTFAARRAGT